MDDTLVTSEWVGKGSLPASAGDATAFEGWKDFRPSSDPHSSATGNGDSPLGGLKD